jgi:hypothetical protein
VSTAAVASGPEIFTAEDKRTQRKTLNAEIAKMAERFDAAGRRSP